MGTLERGWWLRPRTKSVVGRRGAAAAGTKRKKSENTTGLVFHDERGLLHAAAMGDTDALRKFCSRGGEDAHRNAGDGGGDDVSASTGGETGTAEERGENGDGTQQPRQASGNQGGRFSLEEKGDPLGVGTCATPLWWAADGGHLEAVQCLLEYGADPRAADRCVVRYHCPLAEFTMQWKTYGHSLECARGPDPRLPLLLSWPVSFVIVLF